MEIPNIDPISVCCLYIHYLNSISILKRKKNPCISSDNLFRAAIRLSILWFISGKKNQQCSALTHYPLANRLTENKQQQQKQKKKKKEKKRL